MNSTNDTSGSETFAARFLLSRALLAVSVAVTLLLAALVAHSVAHARQSPSSAAWRQHHEECHSLPEELYHRDRFRAIQGRITDEDGKPIPAALVRCVKLESLLELAKTGAPSPASWAVPIEAEATTNDDGKYEFPHLPVGARTFFYSAPGRDLAQAVKDLVVVQDGLGAQLDVTFMRPASLRVRLKDPAKAAMRLHLVPHRWWPTLPAAVVPQGETSVAFTDLGGPFRKGLIATAGPDGASPLRIIGRYDLDRAAEVVLSGQEMPVLRYDLPEAAGLEPWRFEPSTEERLFYAAMSPVALFWREAAFGWPSWLPLPAFLRRWSPDPAGTAHQGPAGAAEAKPEGSSLQSPSLASAPPLLRSNSSPTGIARGFAPHPFLPVLMESRTAGPRLAWTSEASEFEVDGLTAGSYRVRSLDLFGRVTFAAGFSVRPGSTAAQDVRLWSKVDLDEPDSRQVMGFVKWESGLPVARAVVFMQNTYNFRKYVRRVETDEQGYFRFADVPGNEPYFMFALPPDNANAMRSFEYFGVGFFQREVWRELTLHPHRVTGTLTAASPEALLQLVHSEGNAEQVIWTFRAEPSGKFVVANVPHGRYRIQATPGDGGKVIRSLPCDVADGQSEIAVRWSSP